MPLELALPAPGVEEGFPDPSSAIQNFQAAFSPEGPILKGVHDEAVKWLKNETNSIVGRIREWSETKSNSLIASGTYTPFNNRLVIHCATSVPRVLAYSRKELLEFLIKWLKSYGYDVETAFPDLDSMSLRLFLRNPGQQELADNGSTTSTMVFDDARTALPENANNTSSPSTRTQFFRGRNHRASIAASELSETTRDDNTSFVTTNRPLTPSTDHTIAAGSSRTDYERLSVSELSELLRQRKTQLVNVLLAADATLESFR